MSDELTYTYPASAIKKRQQEFMEMKKLATDLMELLLEWSETEAYYPYYNTLSCPHCKETTVIGDSHKPDCLVERTRRMVDPG